MSALQVTPEAIARLSSEERRELVLILEALEMPRLARNIERAKSSPPAPPGTPQISYADALQRAREKRAAWERTATPAELAADRARHEKDFADLDAWRAKKARAARIARGENPDAPRVEPVETPRHVAESNGGMEFMREIERTAETPQRVVERPARVRVERERERFEQSESRANVSVYDDELTMESITRREKAYRENHATGDGEWKN